MKFCGGSFPMYYGIQTKYELPKSVTPRIFFVHKNESHKRKPAEEPAQNKHQQYS